MRGLHVLKDCCAVALLALLACPAQPLHAEGLAERPVELELLLAVDVSGSVDSAEYALQAAGLAAAFADPTVRRAIRHSGSRGVAVAVIQWAGGRTPLVALDWTHLGDDASVTAFSGRLAAMPRLFVGSDTWLGQAVSFGTRLLLANGFGAPRQVIDVSGDGGFEAIGLTRRARDAAVAAGVTVNGLAIENEDAKLYSFFRSNLIGGPGAFALRAVDYDDFAEVMRRKLLREIGEPALARLAR